MYYYIFEPPLEAKEYERTAQIKEYLSSLGIAGEMTSPIPGRTVEDLVQLAVAKRYSTIIAVGGIELINQVARCLEPHDVAFGIIPFQENKDISQLIGVKDWKSAADALKRRRWQPVRLGILNQQLCFLTPASVSFPASTSYKLISPEFVVESKGGTVQVTPLGGHEGYSGRLLVEIIGQTAPKTGWLRSLLTSSPTEPQASRFVVEELDLQPDSPRPVVVASAEICSTPAHYETQEKPIRLIIGKGLTTGKEI